MILALLFVMTLIAGPPTLHLQQTVEEQDLYSKVPVAHRKELRQALNKLIEAEKIGDWKTVYRLSADQNSVTEDQFLKKTGRSVVEFQPLAITFIPPDHSWSIRGCAAFNGDSPGKGQLASVRAFWADSRWHLSPIAIELHEPENGTTLQRCTIHSQK